MSEALPHGWPDEPDFSPPYPGETIEVYLARTWTPPGSLSETRARLSFAMHDLWTAVRDALPFSRFMQ